MTSIDVEMWLTWTWSLERAVALGTSFFALHAATAAWTPLAGARSYPWFVSMIIEFAIHDTAPKADPAGIRPETPPEDLDRRLPWALASRFRAAAWQLRHRVALEGARG
jgi:hypothetical protein